MQLATSILFLLLLVLCQASAEDNHENTILSTYAMTMVLFGSLLTTFPDLISMYGVTDICGTYHFIRRR